MKLINSSNIIENKSKFYGYLYELSSTEEIQGIIEKIKEEHKKARHVCYGFYLKEEKGFHNDSEVGSPGKVLLDLLEKKDLNNHILIVARIFGGIKLGPAGVTKAFRKSGMECLK